METSRSSRYHGWVWGGLVACIPLSDFLLRPSFRAITIYSFETSREAPFILTVAYLAIMLLLAAPIIHAFIRFGMRWERGLRLLLVLLPLIVLVPLSLAGTDATKTLPNVFLMNYTFLVMLLLAMIKYPDDFFNDFLAAVAFGYALVLFVIISYGEYSWGRLTSRGTPNYWGFISIGAIFGSIAVKIVWLRLSILVIGMTTLYLTQARGSMVAVVGGLTVVFTLIWLVSQSQRRTTMVLGGVFALLIGGVVLGPEIADNVLLLGDKERGLASGGTGRMLAWREAWQLIADSPLIGVGFRQHNAYITRASSAHNAYLTVGSELGLFGLAFYVLLMAGGAWRAMRRYAARQNPADLAIAGYLCAFLQLAMLESFSLNTLAVLSLLMAAWSWGDRIPQSSSPSTPLAPAFGSTSFASGRQVSGQRDA